VDVLLGKGDGTFASPVTYAGKANEVLTSIRVADLNADGNLDLVVADSCGQSPCTASDVGVLLGNGDGSFQSMVGYSASQKNVHSPVAADFNSDGRVDLVAGTDSGLVIFAGKGDGTFSSPVFLNANNAYSTLALGQFDANTVPDIAITNAGQAGGDRGFVGVLLGEGNGKFVGKTVGSISHPISVAAQDVNNDGKTDLIVKSGSAQDVYVLLGNGDGTFQKATAYSVSSVFGTITTGDVNNDGLPDLIAADGVAALQVLINTGQ
jgi:hypothetical protein